jgi:hypothetical protein
VGKKHIQKATALRQVNDAIRDGVLSANQPALEWEFFCECGSRDCDQRVALTVEEYGALLDGGRPVLAHGHGLTELGHARQARYAAQEAREAAKALRAQARHQTERAHRHRPRGK